MLGHQGHGFAVAALDDGADGIVNFAGEPVGAIVAGHQVAAQEDLLVSGFEGHLAQITHAEAGDHLAGNGGHLLDVASGSCGHLGVAEDHGLSGSTAKGPHDAGP